MIIKENGLRYSISGDYAKVLGPVKNFVVPKILIIPEIVNDTARVYNIKENAFEGCNTLEELVIPSTITYVGKFAFRGCVNLRTVRNYAKIALSADPWIHTYVGCFSGCKNLESVDLVQNMAYVDVGTFYGCEKLSTITGQISFVRKNGFAGCQNLKSITIGGKRGATLQNDSITNSGINELKCGYIVTIPQLLMKYIQKNGIRIICPQDSPLAELGYQGFNIDTYF